MARIRSHYALISLLRHLRLPHPEPIGARHLMTWFLLAPTLVIVGRATHHELPRWNPNIDEAIPLVHLSGPSASAVSFQDFRGSRSWCRVARIGPPYQVRTKSGRLREVARGKHA